MSISLIKDAEFKQWLVDLKVRIRQSQLKAAVRVNEEMLRLYWELGHDIVVRQMDAVWGNGFYSQVSKELKAEFPDMKGFSKSNLYNMKKFYLFYSQDKQICIQGNNLIRPQLGDELQTSENKDNTILPQLGAKLES